MHHHHNVPTQILSRRLPAAAAAKEEWPRNRRLFSPSSTSWALRSCLAAAPASAVATSSPFSSNVTHVSRPKSQAHRQRSDSSSSSIPSPYRRPHFSRDLCPSPLKPTIFPISRLSRLSFSPTLWPRRRHHTRPSPLPDPSPSPPLNLRLESKCQISFSKHCVC